MPLGWRATHNTRLFFPNLFMRCRTVALVADAGNARNRESARVRGKTPEGLPMDDPEEAFNRNRVRKGFAGDRAGVQETAGVDEKYPSRLMGDVSMNASNASTDDTRRLRKVETDGVSAPRLRCLLPVFFFADILCFPQFFSLIARRKKML